MRRKRCRCCKELYLPDSRTYLQQKSCPNKSCRRWRKRQAQKAWSLKNPFYWDGERIEQKGWRAAHPDYWRQWREKHPQYVKRNRQAQKIRDAKKRGFLAKQDEWRAVCIEKLERIRILRNLAKQDECIELLRRYLRDEVLLAKQDDIAKSKPFLRK